MTLNGHLTGLQNNKMHSWRAVSLRSWASSLISGWHGPHSWTVTYTDLEKTGVVTWRWNGRLVSQGQSRSRWAGKNALMLARSSACGGWGGWSYCDPPPHEMPAPYPGNILASIRAERRGCRSHWSLLSVGHHLSPTFSHLWTGTRLLVP